MLNTNLSNKQIKEIINNVDNDLLNQSKLQFSYETNWKKNFPNQPGVYAAFENNKLIYIGQTADLQSRMSDVRRTYNHTLRKKLGLFRLKGTIEKNKFSEKMEEKLTKYIVKHISFTYHELDFGRLEVESRLVQKYNDQLLNSKTVRGVKNK